MQMNNGKVLSILPEPRARKKMQKTSSCGFLDIVGDQPASGQFPVSKRTTQYVTHQHC